MLREEFLAYLEDYNRGDPALLADHFTEDLIFENYGGRHEGPDALAFLAGLMELLHTRLVPETILVDGAQIGLFGHMEITARVDHVNPAVGAMKKGDRLRARLFAFYDTVGSKISHVRIAGWPPEPVT